MELKLVDVNDEKRRAVMESRAQISQILINLQLFARSLFCVQFTRPLFEQTMPLQLRAVWMRHPLQPHAYPSGEQLMSHLEAISAGGDDAPSDQAVLHALCQHWTLCMFATWARLTPRQVETLQYEVAYLTDGGNLLCAEFVHRTLVFSDDIGHLLKQRPEAGVRFVYVSPDRAFGVSVEHVRDQCAESARPNVVPHLPNYLTHHHVRSQHDGKYIYYVAESDRFKSLYESGGIEYDHASGTYVRHVDASQRLEEYRKHAPTGSPPTRPKKGSRRSGDAARAVGASSKSARAVGASSKSARAVGASPKSARAVGASPKSASAVGASPKSASAVTDLFGDQRTIHITAKCKSKFDGWNRRNESFRIERYLSIDKLTLDQIATIPIQIRARQSSAPSQYTRSDLMYDIKIKYVILS
jgi:hypothetical protein